MLHQPIDSQRTNCIVKAVPFVEPLVANAVEEEAEEVDRRTTIVCKSWEEFVG